ncbi:hypothetical protein B0H14DRAFT_3476817 [Mycena olivaceomarginata]|nr:hypothetical protein B0H14DRAFT_3476817 [Mycena olivaceomarginata]
MAPTEEFDAADQDGSELHYCLKKVGLATSLPPTSSFPIPLPPGQARPARRLAPSDKSFDPFQLVGMACSLLASRPSFQQTQISSDIDPSLQHILHREPEPELSALAEEGEHAREAHAGESAGGDEEDGFRGASGSAKGVCARVWRRDHCTRQLFYAFYGEDKLSSRLCTCCDAR